MNYQQLQPYSFMTQLAAAVYAGNTGLAERILNERVQGPNDPHQINAIITGKRLARPDPLPSPYKEGETNLGDCGEGWRPDYDQR